MPQILIVTDPTEGDGKVVYQERICASDLESNHFSGQLVERVGWAVRDAGELERRSSRVVPLPPPRLSRGRAGAGGLRPSS
jgi:hypothetical protein